VCVCVTVDGWDDKSIVNWDAWTQNFSSFFALRKKLGGWEWELIHLASVLLSNCKLVSFTHLYSPLVWMTLLFIAWGVPRKVNIGSSLFFLTFLISLHSTAFLNCFWGQYIRVFLWKWLAQLSLLWVLESACKLPLVSS